MHRALLLLIAGALACALLQGGRLAQAAVLAPDLRQRMEAAGPGDKVAVIVHFPERLDLKPFAHRNDRAAARTEMVQGLREQARRSQGDLQSFLRRQGAAPDELWLINAMAVSVPPALIPTLAAWPGVAAVEIDGQVAPPAPIQVAMQAAPTDNIATLGVQPLWDAGITGSGVVVASFDSGVDITHPDLASRWRGGSNSWFDPYPTNYLTPKDVDGHGTAVTSLMVGGAASGKTIGVSPSAQWIAAKIFPDSGDADISKIHLAFQWALDPDGDPVTDDAPDVVNNSWGFETAIDQCFGTISSLESFRSDIVALQTVGIHVVFSAGNGGPAAATSVSPANYPEGLAVGSIGSGYAVSPFSARGPVPDACSGSLYTDLPVDVYPEVVVPGELVYVAYPLSVFPFGYANVTGTSFTAAQVSGALALLRSAVPPLAVESAADYRLRLEQALLSTSADLGPPGADNSYGRGLVDLPAAYDHLTGQPHLSIYDPSAPGNDDHLEFGPVTPGTVREMAFALKNSGTAPLDLSAMTSRGAQLSLVANTCPAHLLPGAQCALTIRFSPLDFVSYAGQVVVNSNDPRLPLRKLTVTGVGNSLPPAAQLLTPANSAAGVTLPVTLSWIQEADSDGDPLTLTLLLDTDSHFDPATRTIFVLAPGAAGILTAGMGMFLLALVHNRRRLFLAGAMVTALCLAFACGGGGGGSALVATDSMVVNSLSPSTTYYWKVRTVDSHGGVNESAVWTFTTR